MSIACKASALKRYKACRRNIAQHLCDLRVSNVFLDWISKAQPKKEQNGLNWKTELNTLLVVDPGGRIWEQSGLLYLSQ